MARRDTGCCGAQQHFFGEADSQILKCTRLHEERQVFLGAVASHHFFDRRQLRVAGPLTRLNRVALTTHEHARFR